MNTIYFCAREGLACGTHNRNKPTLTLSCRGYVKSPKHDHRSCAISIFLFKSILFAGEIEYLDNLNLLNVIVMIISHLSSISSRVVSSEAFIFLPSHHGWSRPRCPLLLTSFDSCHSTRHWQAVECCNCDELCFRIIQMSIIAKICSSSFNIVRALLFLYLSKCMSRHLLSTS